MNNNNFRETLADLCHKQWSGWMKYLFTKGTFVRDENASSRSWVMWPEFVRRWTRQMNTPYLELPESEQDSDRKEADKFIAVFLPLLNDAFDKAEQETAEQYNQQTCSLPDKDGDSSCPICYFRQQVKKHLGYSE